MKLEKAIKKLTRLLDAETTPLTFTETEALELVIEAAERIIRQRYSPLAHATTLLPGETE